LPIPYGRKLREAALEAGSPSGRRLTDVHGRAIDVGDFFADDQSSWSNGFDELAEDDSDRYGGLRPTGLALAVLSVGLLVVAFVYYGISLSRGAAGAESGGIVVIAAFTWMWYLSLDRSQQHAPLLKLHRSVSYWLDGRVDPFRERTESQLHLRRERQRFDAMRDERSRRINELGEAAYRNFRRGELAPELARNAQRVLAIEQQMLLQDARVTDLQNAAPAGSAKRTVRSQSRNATGADAVVSQAPFGSGRPAVKRKKRRRPRR